VEVNAPPEIKNQPVSSKGFAVLILFFNDISEKTGEK
jgi:hypothetical protein